MRLFRLGRRIHDLRMAQGLSLETLAAKVGLSPEDLEALEIGEFDPSFLTLERISEVLGQPLFLQDERAHHGVGGQA